MAMKKYTGWQWLLIDVANQFGLDKLKFEERIQWATENLEILESLVDQAETKPLYIKAVMAIRKVQAGKPTGHLVGVDACCSGIQIMSVLTGCEAGSLVTGLIDPDTRADAYTSVTERMKTILGGNLNVSRKDAKEALMTSFYGSKLKPVEIFGKDTNELTAFYRAAQDIAPGAWELLQDLLNSWKPYALSHEWKMPDGFDVKIKVMKKIDGNDSRSRIEVDELNHATFTYEYFINEGSKSGLSNVANTIHSVDAWILRSMHRRCNYNHELVLDLSINIQVELMERNLEGKVQLLNPEKGSKFAYYLDQYSRSGLVDVVILPYLNGGNNLQYLSTEHLEGLAKILSGVLEYKPFPLVTVHDEFKAHPSNINHVRFQYKEILAEIADSNLLDDILSQLYGEQGNFSKLSTNLGDKIREGNYALC